MKNEKSLKGVMIVRRCGDGQVDCLRVVDYIGDVCNLQNVRNQLQNYIQINKLEYVDFVEVGLKDEDLVRAGFINRRDYENLVIPNYFEPFLQENVDLDYAFKSVVPDAQCVFFKADADQDRPNVL